MSSHKDESSAQPTNPTKEYMDLDQIYKTGLPVSHEAGLAAVYRAGQESVFLAPAPDTSPVVPVIAIPVPDAPANGQ